MPKVCVIHGSADITVPSSEALTFSKTLNTAGCESSVKIYENWSHTDPILEAPMCGDQLLHRDVYDLVRGWYRTPVDGEAFEFDNFDDQIPACKRIVPDWMAKCARKFNPF